MKIHTLIIATIIAGIGLGGMAVQARGGGGGGGRGGGRAGGAAAGDNGGDNNGNGGGKRGGRGGNGGGGAGNDAEAPAGRGGRGGRNGQAARGAGGGLAAPEAAADATTDSTASGRRGRGARGGRAAGADATADGTAAGRRGGRGVDAREANQHRRIEQGIKKGQLTPDETTKLQGLETNIQKMESQFKSDGNLSKDEAKQLRQQLDDASLQIWSERHDTEGNQKPVSRLGKDIFAQDQLTTKIESGQMSKADARKFLGDFRRMANIKRRLANDTLTDAERTAMQTEYNDLLSNYFTTTAPAK